MGQFKHICIILQLPPPHTGIITGKQPKKKMKLGFRINTGRKTESYYFDGLEYKAQALKKIKKNSKRSEEKNIRGFLF